MSRWVRLISAAAFLTSLDSSVTGQRAIAACKSVHQQRNLHDGAQQRLVALSVELGLHETRFARDPDSAPTIVARPARTSSRRWAPMMAASMRGMSLVAVVDGAPAAGSTTRSAVLAAARRVERIPESPV